MNELKVFSNEEFGELEVWIGPDRKPWFPATESATMLGYADPHKAIAAHTNSDGWANRPVIDSMGRTQQKKYINRPNLSRLIARSNLPGALRFEAWIFEEVLESVFDRGLYATPETIEQILTDPKSLIIMLQTIQAEREQRMALEGRIEQDKRFTNFGKAMDVSSDTMLIGDFAKVVCNSGIRIGRTRLFRWLRDHRYLMKNNSPYQKYVNQGLFAVKEYIITAPKGDIIKTTTLVTGKGQTVLLDALQRAFDVDESDEA